MITLYRSLSFKITCSFLFSNTVANVNRMFEYRAHARSVYKNKNKFNSLIISELWLKNFALSRTCDQMWKSVFHIRLHIDMVQFDNSSVLRNYCLELVSMCRSRIFFFDRSPQPIFISLILPPQILENRAWRPNIPILCKKKKIANINILIADGWFIQKVNFIPKWNN